MTDHVKQLANVAGRLARAYADRDAAIIAAHDAGMKVTHIARAVQLSRAQVHRILKEARDSSE